MSPSQFSPRSSWRNSVGGAMLSYLQFDSAAIWSGWSGLATCYLCVRSCAHAIRSSLVRDRDVHAIRVWARSGTFYWTTSLYSLLYRTVIGSACRASDAAGAVGARRLPVRQRFTLRSLLPSRPFIRTSNSCCGSLRSGLHWYSGCHRHSSTAGRTPGSDLVVALDKHVACAFLFIELNGAGPELAWWNAVKARFASKPKYHVLPKPRARTGGSRSESEDVYTSIDPILDKISKFGIGSLTASERRQLDRERERLLKNSE